MFFLKVEINFYKSLSFENTRKTKYFKKMSKPMLQNSQMATSSVSLRSICALFLFYFSFIFFFFLIHCNYIYPDITEITLII